MVEVATNPLADMNYDNSEACGRCGEVLDSTAVEAERTVCYACYCEMQR